jgi:hypothetical protein
MPIPLQLSSPFFKDGDPIPIAYTCEGEDKAPPLHIEGIPAGTRSLALVVEDPDAPDPRHPERTWCHWLLYNIPTGTRDLAEGGSLEVLPPGCKEGVNDWGRFGYGGPCPPIGQHRYFYRLYALDTVLPDLGKVTRKEFLAIIQGHVVAETSLIGTYEKYHENVVH